MAITSSQLTLPWNSDGDVVVMVDDDWWWLCLAMVMMIAMFTMTMMMVGWFVVQLNWQGHGWALATLMHASNYASTQVIITTNHPYHHHIIAHRITYHHITGSSITAHSTHSHTYSQSLTLTVQRMMCCVVMQSRHWISWISIVFKLAKV